MFGTSSTIWLYNTKIDSKHYFVCGTLWESECEKSIRPESARIFMNLFNMVLNEYLIIWNYLFVFSSCFICSLFKNQQQSYPERVWVHEWVMYLLKFHSRWPFHIYCTWYNWFIAIILQARRYAIFDESKSTNGY